METLTAAGVAAVLGQVDLERETVDVPEWGVRVQVRGMTAAERDAFEQSTFEMRGKNVKLNLANARARLVAICCVDFDGQRLFADGDVSTLGQKSGKAVDRLYAVAQRLSGLRKEDIEELAGN